MTQAEIEPAPDCNSGLAGCVTALGILPRYLGKITFFREVTGCQTLYVFKSKVKHPILERIVSQGRKKIFLKSPSRTRIFKEMAPEIPLSPKSTVTRWGTWLYAAIYYGKYYNRNVEILNVLDDEDSAAIEEAKCLVSNQLLIDLKLIANKFQDLSKTITLLQSINMEMIEVIRLVEGLSTANIRSEDEKIVSVQQKFKNILKKNVGFSKLCEIRNKINPIDKSLNSIDSDCDSVTWFKFAHTTSCDVERTFSQLKNCLSENRRSFSFDNLRTYVVVHCNKSYDSCL
ncbi:hypothetical protein ANN_08130 [Periplaneta americana]|uniref:Uncharacterized protein n=1 Tax=Periplaneta americana TaxID=6978 RepID=A0ABQ8T1R3_PERAM|nr:hypothetical protein ANN_08130 [Periplaneta americana]